VHYDLRKMARRVLVADTGTRTLSPAVSPDGKQVAVARWALTSDRSSQLQITVYHLDGKEAHRSRAYPWNFNGGDQAAPSPTSLFWPGADKIVVLAGQDTALYDPFQNTLVRVATCFPWLVGNNPGRPDGKGFLALLGQGGGQKMAFVTWDGKARPLDFSPVTGKEGAWDGLAWDRAVASFRTSGASYRLDTVKLTVKRDETGKLGA